MEAGRWQGGAVNETEALEALELVSKSGFPFQRRVAWEVVQTIASHQFGVEGEEVGWTDGRGAHGFIDLVLGRRGLCIVVECKRRSAHPWIFLRTDKKDNRRSPHSDRVVCVQRDLPQPRVIVGNANLRHVEVEADACVVPGSDKNRRTLEPIAFQLVQATEALANQAALELNQHIEIPHHRIMVPMIVTNLPLWVCSHREVYVSLDEGVIPKGGGTVEEVPWLRFRKGFAVEPSGGLVQTISDLAEDRERTVFVVQASRLGQFLAGMRPVEIA